MKKQLISAFFILLSYATNSQVQDQEYHNWLLHQRLPEWAERVFEKNVSGYELTDFINPFYIEADFNGDGKNDIAIAIYNEDNQKKGLIIFHQSAQEIFIIGAGQKLGHFDDLWWMDILKVNYDLDNHELTYKEDGDIDDAVPLKLMYPSIYVGKSESSSGLIFWNGKEYKWAQMGD